MTDPTTVDLRGMEPRLRHPLIFKTFDGLAPGEALLLVNDHDPKPLFYQFQAERPGEAEWHPGAAASLREGLAETLTIIRLGVPPTLARTLRSTNPIESMIEICRDHSRNVKRWQDGKMARRWCAAGMLEARKQFRRVNGHLHMNALRAALDEHATTANVTPDRSVAEKEVA